MKLRSPATKVAVVSASFVLLAGCGSAGRSATGSDLIPIVASTNVYGSVVSAVGGSRVSVTSMINNANADPLKYETTAADAIAVKNARLVVFNGNGYDTFMPKLVEAAGAKTVVIEVVDLSGLKTAAGDGAFNEHVFYDLATIEKVADQVAKVLSSNRPKDAATFVANAEAFKVKIEGLRTQLAAIAKAHPGARVAVTEPLPGYLVREAGLENVTPAEFAEAIEEGSDPSAAALADMLSLFGRAPVKALILNTQTQGPATDQVAKAARAAGVPVVSMSETLTSPDFVTWMDGQITALASALHGS
jgi:zinc/manganese transport system substrate-binding protein